MPLIHKVYQFFSNVCNCYVNKDL